MRNFFYIFFLFFLVSLNAETPTKKPVKAAALSFLPAGGQIYNGSYFRAAITLGVEGVVFSRILYWDDKAENYKKKLNAIYEGSSDESLFYYQNLYDEAKENRVSMKWWLGVTVLVSMLDAYVDAHLNNFNDKEKSIHIFFKEKKVGLQLRF